MPNQAHLELLAVEVTARLRSAFQANPLDENEIRNAVCAFVDEGKLKDWPVERIIVGIKRMFEAAEETRIATGLLTDNGQRLDFRKLQTRAITWSVERFYSIG
jgi:hypothetical protein